MAPDLLGDDPFYDVVLELTFLAQTALAVIANTTIICINEKYIYIFFFMIG